MVALLPVGNRLDATTSAELRPAAQALVETTAGPLVLDLTSCSFLDTAGIGLLMLLHKRLLTSGRRLYLYRPKGQPRHLIGFLSVDRAIPVLEVLPEGAQTIA